MNFLNKTKQLKTVLVLLCVFFISTSITAQEFKLVDLKADQLLSSLSGTHDGGTSKVSIAYGNITNDPTFTTPCFSYAPGSLYFNNYGVSGYSYITIDNLGSDDITAIEITGVSGGGGWTPNLYVAFSDKPSAATSDEEYSDNLDFYAATQEFYGAESGCQTKRVSPPDDPDNTASGLTVSFVKSVKIALTTSFGNEGLSPQYPFRLQGIAIYTDRGPTGISNAIEETFTGKVADEELNLSEPATKVSFYTISGTLVKTAENTQNVSLKELPLGVYIVKALSNTGKTLVTKIAR